MDFESNMWPLGTFTSKRMVEGRESLKESVKLFLTLHSSQKMFQGFFLNSKIRSNDI